MRTVAGKTITVHIDPTSTVRSLAQQICEKEGLPTEIVRLVCEYALSQEWEPALPTPLPSHAHAPNLYPTYGQQSAHSIVALSLRGATFRWREADGPGSRWTRYTFDRP